MELPVRLIEPQGEVRCEIAAIGDVGLVGSARARAAREGYDAVLAHPARHLRAADLGFANLEFPVGRRAWVRAGRSNEFHHDAELIPALRRAGVSIVSLATNHAMDCGPDGLSATLDACAAAGVAVVGAGADLDAARRPAILEARGRRVGWLAYAQSESDAAGPRRPGVAPLDAAMIGEDLASLQGSADLRVVSLHWGSMYVDYPPPRVLELARAVAAAGADLVLGHHPHVVQGVRRIGSTLVFFSLGDGVFNCRAGDFHASIAAETRLISGVFRAILAAEHGADYEPHRLDQDGLPVEAGADERERWHRRLRELSDGLEEGAARFARESAGRLLQYELESVGHYLRQGRVDKIAKLLLAVRPRHLPVIWQGLRRRGRTARREARP